MFSQEVSSGGERRFLVCAKESFWSLYKSQEVKHYYEVIPQNIPCKLYFDLEFMIALNPLKDGHLMTERLIALVNQNLQNYFKCASFTEDVLILESSNEKKFSIHLIFSKAIFQDNISCGAFVRTFINNLSIGDKSYLTVMNNDSEETSFIDTSVYSKNRNFRLYLSRKYGKKTPLEVSPIDIMSMTILENNNFIPNDEFEETIFMKSLITNVEKGIPKINYEVEKTKKEARCIKGSPTRENKFIKSSPYTEIDSFISSLIGSGWIRQWKYYADTDTLLYDIGGSRWCGRVGREHRSNHVYYTCHLARGVVQQGCHDPACRGWRGAETQLPGRVGDPGDAPQFDEADDQFLLEASFGY